MKFYRCITEVSLNDYVTFISHSDVYICKTFHPNTTPHNYNVHVVM